MANLVSKYRDLFSNPNYSKLCLAGVLSELGSQISRIALLLLVYKLSGLTRDVAGLIFVETLPAVALGLYIGALIDRWNRKFVMVAADILRGVVVALVPLASELWQIYLLAFLAVVGTNFFLPSRDAVIPEIVPFEKLLAANSLTASYQGFILFLGPAISGAIIGFWDIKAAFWINSATFFLSAILICRMVLAKRKKEQPRLSFARINHEAMEGVHYIRKAHIVRYIMLINFIGTMAFTILFPLLPDFNAKFLHGTDFTFGLITSAFGVGGLIGGPIGSGIGERFGKGKVLYFTFCLDGLFMMLFASIPFVWANLVVTALWGISGFILYVVYISLMQETIPADKRGRAFAIGQLIWSSAMLVAQGIAAVLGSLIPPQHILLMAGLFYFLAIMTSRFVKGYRELQVL